jgi:crotonobetainyl-CoA:carnitine CoA-transferase CaiB-like acyl-CoA transferase
MSELLPSAYRVTELAVQSIDRATRAIVGPDAPPVDPLHAVTAFRSERHLRIDGQPPASPWGPIAGTYRTADDGWVQIHANFPHHERGALDVLGLAEPDREAVTVAVATWEAAPLEDALADAGMCASMLRSTSEWSAHPHGQALAPLPELDVEPIAAAPPEVDPPGDRPLAGVRVLDLTRVIAGPVCGRFLAAHGAEVLKVDAPHLPQIAPLVIDTGPGKRSCFLDLDVPVERDRFEALVRDADVVVDGYRPGALGTRGLTPEALVTLRPGLIVVSLSAYGPVGPWAARRGFDSLVQTATGVAHAGMVAAGADRPVPLPCQALDHGTGYLAAAGVGEALARRRVEGSSWLVRVSLARTRHWLERIGPLEGGLDLPEPEVPAELLQEMVSPFGRVTLVRPPSGHWDTPPVPLGTHEPAWLS